MRASSHVSRCMYVRGSYRSTSYDFHDFELPSDQEKERERERITRLIVSSKVPLLPPIDRRQIVNIRLVASTWFQIHFFPLPFPGNWHDRSGARWCHVHGKIGADALEKRGTFAWRIASVSCPAQVFLLRFVVAGNVAGAVYSWLFPVGARGVG